MFDEDESDDLDYDPRPDAERVTEATQVTSADLLRVMEPLQEMAPAKAAFLLHAAAEYLRLEYFEGEGHVYDVLRTLAEHCADDLHTHTTASERGTFVVDGPSEVA